MIHRLAADLVLLFHFVFVAKEYKGGFVQHYLGPLVYLQGMPRQLELVAGVSIALWNGVLYGCIYWWLSRGASAA